MSKWCLSFVLGLIMFLSVCTEKEYDIVIMLTCPQNKEMKYGGMYLLKSADEDTILLDGYTPGEYTLTMSESDTFYVSAWKDTSTIGDTLWFEVYVDASQEFSVYLTGAFEVATFVYP